MDSDTAIYRVALGPVMQAKLPPGDPRWPEFNGSFVNKDLPGLDIAARLYDGHPITTWHKNHWRQSCNYQMGQHLGIDFDTNDERSSLPHLLKDPFIKKYGAIVYTTPSHTPAAPRARAIFLLDTPIHQAVNYSLAATALLWVFGSADRQCKDAVRFYYGGRPGACEMEWIGNELPLAVIRDMIVRYQATGAHQRKRLSRTFTGQTPDQNKVIDALHHIDAWGIEYDEWVSILMAIHSEFPGEEGLQIAETWADGKPGETEQKWRSFDRNGNGLGRVGIGTLFAIAKKAGWQQTHS